VGNFLRQKWGIFIDNNTYKSLKSILEKGLEQLELPLSLPEVPTPVHENIRGAAYYQETRANKLLH
jgi:hypothetical protein